MVNYADKAAENLKKLREEKPLIHNITNFVVMNFTANALLAAGASPVMAHAEGEVEEMAAMAGALVVNIGTLTDSWVNSMITAGRRCSELGTPIVLDPVGAGATGLRTSAARRILAETSVRIVRGNGSEILALASEEAGTKGVDSLHGVEEAARGGKALAVELGVTLAITGAVDMVTDGRRTLRVEGGHPLMPAVTGTGCAATAIVAAFAAVDDDPVSAAATGLAFYGLAGERAGAVSAGPGSFAVALLDALFSLTPDELHGSCRITSEG